MKIVGVDDLNRETVDDFVAAENIRNTWIGEIMINALNDHDNGTFYRLVPNEYELYKYEI